MAVLFDCHCCCAANFIRFCFCLWLQNQTLTTFFLRSSFSAMAAIFSPDGLGCTAKYASSDRFSGAAMEVLFLEKRLDIDYSINDFQSVVVYVSLSRFKYLLIHFINELMYMFLSMCSLLVKYFFLCIGLLVLKN